MTKRHDIIWLKEVDSTNNYVRRHIGQLDNLSVVAAMSQTSGRGQGDHRWHSASGENLLFSIFLKNQDITATDQTLISHITAESVVRLLDSHDIEAWIKPPNDIWVDKKKICGILIEHSLRAGRISWSIIGIGLNVNQMQFPDDLPNPTSMALENGKEDISRLLDELLEIFTDLASRKLR